jgi:hypothetical protein
MLLGPISMFFVAKEAHKKIEKHVKETKES